MWSRPTVSRVAADSRATFAKVTDAAQVPSGGVSQENVCRRIDALRAPLESPGSVRQRLQCCVAGDGHQHVRVLRSTLGRYERAEHRNPRHPGDRASGQDELECQPKQRSTYLDGRAVAVLPLVVRNLVTCHLSFANEIARCLSNEVRLCRTPTAACTTYASAMISAGSHARRQCRTVSTTSRVGSMRYNIRRYLPYSTCRNSSRLASGTLRPARGWRRRPAAKANKSSTHRLALPGRCAAMYVAISVARAIARGAQMTLTRPIVPTPRPSPSSEQSLDRQQPLPPQCGCPRATRRGRAAPRILPDQPGRRHSVHAASRSRIAWYAALAGQPPQGWRGSPRAGEYPWSVVVGAQWTPSKCTE